MFSIGVIGAGTWGLALARVLSLNGNNVTVWSAIPSEIDELVETRRNNRLPDMVIPDNIVFTKSIEEVCKKRDIILFAVPSVFVRETAAKIREFIPKNQIIVDVAKGIEKKTHYMLSEVITTEIKKDGKHDNIEVVALSGPTHAEEVALDLPTTIVSTCENETVAKFVQDIFMSENLRVYTNNDIKGVELCGALKNIVALAAGISQGLGYGDNAKAALITRGMSEIKRLGLAMGCLESTFEGLAGVGDLIVTATSEHSRNNKAGQLIGQGYSVQEALDKVQMVVEGVNALPAALELSETYQIELPIIFAVNDIINKGHNPAQVVKELMNRNKRFECEKSILDITFENTILKNKRGNEMKRVITYGTFDLLHYGHINLLKRAKALGDYLVVVISSDEFNWNEKQKKCYFSYEQRKALVEAVRYVDLVIPETSWEQKKSDVHEYHIDTFVMGDDWKGKFDFLEEEGVEVVYLPRTPEISTTQIKKDLGN